MVQAQLQFTCDEAGLTLRTKQHGRSANNGIDERYTAALIHYLGCNRCRELGLAGILETKLPCEQFLLTWLEFPGPLWQEVSPIVNPTKLGPASTRQILAVEHVYGLYRWNPEGGSGHDLTTGCKHNVCTDMRTHWQRAPLSAEYNGEEEVIGLFPTILKSWLGNHLPLWIPLLAQDKRVDLLVHGLETGQPLVSPGYYTNCKDLVREIKAHFNVRRDLMMALQRDGITISG